jgi:hypothetical protein
MPCQLCDINFNIRPCSKDIFAINSIINISQVTECKKMKNHMEYRINEKRKIFLIRLYQNIYCHCLCSECLIKNICRDYCKEFYEMLSTIKYQKEV